jgi:hypothetical protein
MEGFDSEAKGQRRVVELHSRWSVEEKCCFV